jgi:hypothetical protein
MTVIKKSDIDWESSLPNYDFFAFPIFAIKLGHFKYKQYFLMQQTLTLNNEKQKKSLFYEEKKFGRIDSGTYSPTKG